MLCIQVNILIGQISNFNEERYLIQFKPGTSQSKINQFYNDFNSIELWKSPVSDIRYCQVLYFGFQIPGTSNFINNINEVIATGKPKSEVNSIGLDYETDLPFGNNTEPFNPEHIIGDCENKFSLVYDGANPTIKIAILDTGVKYFYEGGVKIFAAHSLLSPYYESYVGYDFVNNDADPIDDHRHGTHIAGIIAKIQANSGNINVILESYKTHDQNGLGSISDIILAVDQAILNSCQVINMSFSFEGEKSVEKPDPLEVAIEKAGDYNILVIAAAGNDNKDNDFDPYPSYPASYDSDNIVAVGSVECEFTRSHFSNYGRETVDLMAAGEKIIGPDLTGSMIPLNGTSQATGITTGVAAIAARQQSNFDQKTLKCALLESAYKNFYGLEVYTGGIVSAADASLAILQATCKDKVQKGNNLVEIPPTDLPVEGFLNIFPNPTNNAPLNISFSAPSSGIAHIVILDTYGRTIALQKWPYNNGYNQFQWPNTTSLTPGIYFAKIQLSENEIYHQKFIKK